MKYLWLFIFSLPLLGGEWPKGEWPKGEWIEQKGKVAAENYTIAFPGVAAHKASAQESTLFYRDGTKALYILSVNNPPLRHDPIEAVKKLLSHHNQGMKGVTSYSVTAEGDKTYLDLEVYNAKTAVRTKIRYVITPTNIWQLKTAFSEEEEQNHDKFIASFDLN